jgi:hypothetical protein
MGGGPVRNNFGGGAAGKPAAGQPGKDNKRVRIIPDKIVF